MEDKNITKLRNNMATYDSLGYDGLKMIRNSMVGIITVTSLLGIGLIALMFSYGVIPLIFTTIVVTWYLNGMISGGLRAYNMFKEERNA